MTRIALAGPGAPGEERIPGGASQTRPPGVCEWTLVIPVKHASLGKSRLRVPGVDREELARAIALDTICAATSCDRVAETIVVTSDEVTASALRPLGAVRVVRDDADGLRAAIRRGLAAARPDAPRAVLLGDLPALRPEELSRALARVGEGVRVFVPDAEGTGTSLVAARAGVPLDPLFGPDSAHAHRGAGFVELTLPASGGLRRDLDTAEHLSAIRRSGLGPRTAALLAGLGDES